MFTIVSGIVSCNKIDRVGTEYNEMEKPNVNHRAPTRRLMHLLLRTVKGGVPTSKSTSLGVRASVLMC